MLITLTHLSQLLIVKSELKLNQLTRRTYGIKGKKVQEVQFSFSGNCER